MSNLTTTEKNWLRSAKTRRSAALKVRLKESVEVVTSVIHYLEDRYCKMSEDCRVLADGMIEELKLDRAHFDDLRDLASTMNHEKVMRTQAIKDGQRWMQI